MMSSDEQGVKKKVIKEDNYRGKSNEGRITVGSDRQFVVDKVEEGFKKEHFKVRYISESSLEAKKDFDMSHPFRNIGAIEVSFFEYGEDVVVYYKLDNLWGLSYVTFTILVIYGVTAATWFQRNGISEGSFNVILPLLLFIAIFIYQRKSNFVSLKKTVSRILDNLK